ncbi:hypothetical protein ACF068_30655 [Streptomyces sp. NPDC016309]|uniref:hypothetical protein n=1 Tax=Streptomyces sp. NPDC016309 TaxID=3364965 RepID=UPI0036FF5D35
MNATSQAHRALVLAVTGLGPADEVHLAEQLLIGLDLRATSFTVRIAALVFGTGTLPALEVARALRAETRDAGITAAEAILELALAVRPARSGQPARFGARTGGCFVGRCPVTVKFDRYQ